MLIFFTAQQKHDYSIAAGLQYEVGDKCQVSDYVEEEKLLLEILFILIGTKKQLSLDVLLIWDFRIYFIIYTF